MIVKTIDLTDLALNWAAAKCEGVTVEYVDDGITKCLLMRAGARFNPSTNWSQGGPIIEREGIEWQWLPSSNKSHRYGARKPSLGGMNRTFCMDGPTILVAAMRCYVASKLGDEIYVPDELI